MTEVAANAPVATSNEKKLFTDAAIPEAEDEVFESTGFEKRNKQTNQPEGNIKIEKPIQVLFEGADLNKYFPIPDEEIPGDDLVLELDEITVFNGFADMSLICLQITVCTITMLINDNLYVSALSMFLDQVTLNK